MTSRRLKPKDSLIDRIHIKQIIAETVRETEKNIGRAVFRRFGISWIGIGFVLGVVVTSLIWYYV